MKRKIALLILMILALSVALTACNQTVSTTVRTRWEKETHVFNITLADFERESSNSFNAYTSDGKPSSNGTHVKDIAFSNEFANWDEIRPLAVNGTYTLNITPSPDGSAYCDVATVQEMCVAYNATDIDANSELHGAKASAEQMEQCGMVDTFDGNAVILYSKTETSVRFENTTSQKPLSSSTKVNGFYAGKVAQKLSNYEISTEYSYENNRPVAKITVDGGESTEYTFPKNSAGSFIDSNQLLMYLRSLGKTANSFQDSPTKSVFNPYTQTIQTSSFGMLHEYNVILTDPASPNGALAVTLTAASIMIGNSAFLMQLNLPDYLTDKTLDKYNTVSGEQDFKYTTVRFRVGYLSYEIDYASAQNTSNWSDILTTLSTPATSED